jgi:serine protease Do
MNRFVFSKKSKVLLVVIIALAGFFVINNFSKTNNIKTGITSAQADEPFGPQTFIKVAEKEKPSVVNISTTQIIKRTRPPGIGPQHPFSENDPFWDFFEKFFGDMPQEDIKKRSLGSGFIIDKEGLILTNNHVIQGASEIKVKLHDEREFDAKVIGTDPKTDLALIKINAKDNLPVTVLGDSDKLQVGEWVMAIGNPFGLTETVTVGVVSAKGRVIGAGPYDDFIQTDASINPGNSGGPLLNIKGEVVGINAAIYAGGQGIGFAIPINIAKEVLHDLKTKGKVVRGWLGVMIQKITPELAKSFDLKESEGALVSDVVPKGPADDAKIKRGDVIIEFDGKKIESMEMLPRLVAATKPKSKVTVVVLRNGKKKKLSVVVGEMKEQVAKASEEPSEDIEKTLGMSVQQITPDIKRYFNLQDETGVVISNVLRNGMAAEAGLAVGDIIKEINRKPVRNLDDYRKMMKGVKKNDTILLLIKRGETTLFVPVKTG